MRSETNSQGLFLEEKRLQVMQEDLSETPKIANAARNLQNQADAF
jgi:hypothetical protein